jgi:6-phosphofructokinase
MEITVSSGNRPGGKDSTANVAAASGAVAAQAMASAAIRALVEGQDGVMVAVNPPRFDYIPLRVATAMLKFVAADDYGMMTARTLDVSFGD